MPVDLARVLSSSAGDGRLLLVDFLTLWLSNLLHLEEPMRLARERDALVEVLPELKGCPMLVANEIHLGVIPANAPARRFHDESGLLHQALAERCENVTLTVAGLPHVLGVLP